MTKLVLLTMNTVSVFFTFHGCKTEELATENSTKHLDGDDGENVSISSKFLSKHYPDQRILKHSRVLSQFHQCLLLNSVLQNLFMDHFFSLLCYQRSFQIMKYCENIMKNLWLKDIILVLKMLISPLDMTNAVRLHLAKIWKKKQVKFSSRIAKQ